MHQVGVNRSRIFTIIVNNYNYGQFLKEAVDSALNQTYPHTEVVVVDDGSTDNSRDIIASFGSSITTVLKENEGQASSFNAGYSKSRGDVVIFLDSDDVLLPQAAANVVGFFQDPDLVNVHWPQYVIDENGARTGALKPQVDLPDGDLRQWVAENGPLSLRIAPTSGNAWSRRFLEQAMPVWENGDKHGADDYLLCLASVLGLSKTVRQPQGYYRIHGQNFNQDDAHAKHQRYMRRFLFYSQILSDRLNELGIPFDPNNWRRPGSLYARLQELLSLPAILSDLIPVGTTYILVDEGQFGSNWLKERRALPFVEHNGQYWGPPADDAAAIHELDRMRAMGAAHIVFVRDTLWWLSHYTGFQKYLTGNFASPLMTEAVAVFDLRSARQSRQAPVP